LFDGLHLQVEVALPCPRRCPLGDRCLLEHGCPQMEALVGEVLAFPA
jgi:hypothetical protein